MIAGRTTQNAVSFANWDHIMHYPKPSGEDDASNKMGNLDEPKVDNKNERLS